MAKQGYSKSVAFGLVALALGVNGCGQCPINPGMLTGMTSAIQGIGANIPSNASTAGSLVPTAIPTPVPTFVPTSPANLPKDKNLPPVDTAKKTTTTGLTPAQLETLQATIRYELGPYIDAAINRAIETVMVEKASNLAPGLAAQAQSAIAKAIRDAKASLVAGAEAAAATELSRQVAKFGSTSPDDTALRSAQAEIRSAASRTVEARATALGRNGFAAWFATIDEE